MKVLKVVIGGGLPCVSRLSCERVSLALLSMNNAVVPFRLQVFQLFFRFFRRPRAVQYPVNAPIRASRVVTARTMPIK